MYQGYYINLDKNEKRRESLTRHLQEVGAADRYQRFPAVDGRLAPETAPPSLKRGSLGLWLTHRNLLETCAGSDLHIHIIEDDAQLPQNAVEQFEKILLAADRKLPEWDVLFTETFVPFEPEVFKAFARAVAGWKKTGYHAFADLRPVFLAGATSMFLNKASIGKFTDLMAGRWEHGIPRDMYLRKLIRDGRLKAQVTLPFMTTYSAELGNDSDIRGSLDASHQITDIFRRSFFQEADIPALMQDMQQLSRSARINPHSALYLSALSFTLSDQWVPF